MYTTWCHYQLSDNRFLKLVLLLQPSKQVTVSIKTWSCGGAYSINKCVLDSFSQTLETGESRSIICWQRRWTGEVVVGAAAECQGKLALVTQSGQLGLTWGQQAGGESYFFFSLEWSHWVAFDWLQLYVMTSLPFHRMGFAQQPNFGKTVWSPIALIKYSTSLL